MKWPGMLLILLVIQALAVEEKIEDWSVVGYSCPADVLTRGSEAVGKGKLELPGLGWGNPSTDQLRTHIRRGSFVFRELLPELPEGTLILLDRERQTLAAWTTLAGHVEITALLEDWSAELPRVIEIKVDVLNVSETGLDEIAAEAGGDDANHSAIMSQLENAGAERVSIKLEAVSDKPAKIEANGMLVEVDPVMSFDGRIVDMRLVVQRSGVGADAVVLDSNKWSSFVTVASGQTRFVGGWQNAGSPSSTVCFLTATPSIVRRKHDTRAVEWLKTHGEAVEPTPKRASAADAPAMVRKRFEPPSGYISSLERLKETGSSPALQTPQEPVRRNVEEALRSQGCDFPPGSSAIYNRLSGVLTVYNTPRNMGYVETLMEACCQLPPKIIPFSVVLVEAKAEVMKKLMRESSGVTDHQEAWEACGMEIKKGHARVMEALALETRSGKGCRFESVKAPGKLESLAFQVELEPVLGPDGLTLDVNFSMKRERRTGEVAVSKAADEPVMAYLPLAMTTSFTTRNGLWRMIGAWPTTDEEGEDMQAVFVRAVVLWVSK